MALEDKIVPQQYKNVDLSRNNIYPSRSGKKDVLPKVILLILSFITLVILSIVSYSSMVMPQIMVLIVGLGLSIALTVILAIALFGKDKRIDNSNHLFYFRSEVTNYKIVDNFSDSQVSILGETNTQNLDLDENGEKVYYAEEIYDDEEDIFAIEAADTKLEKEKETTYQDLVNNFNESLESYGVNGDVATKLLAAMTFSNLIDVTSIKGLMPTIFRIFDLPTYILHYDADESIVNQKVLANTFEYAKTHQNSPIFILFDEIPAKEFLEYLRPLYRYIDDPNGDYYISLNGVATHIPHNVIFLFALKDKEVIYDIARRYLRYIAIVKAEYTTRDDIEGEKKGFELTFNQLNNARRNALDNYAIEELTYKKLDLLFNMANEANGYVLQNKIQRKIELFSSFLLSLGQNEDDVIDLCLANNVIAAVIISSEPQKLTSEFNLIALLDNEFGADKMKLTKARIKEYISLFNAKGERNNA